MSKTVKEIKRNAGGREFTGTVTFENGEYIYHYPEVKEINAKLTGGDRGKIAHLLGVTPVFVINVLKGLRWNSIVVELAMEIAEQNDRMAERFRAKEVFELN